MASFRAPTSLASGQAQPRLVSLPFVGGPKRYLSTDWKLACSVWVLTNMNVARCWKDMVMYAPGVIQLALWLARDHCGMLGMYLRGYFLNIPYLIKDMRTIVDKARVRRSWRTSCTSQATYPSTLCMISNMVRCPKLVPSRTREGGICRSHFEARQFQFNLACFSHT